MNEKTLDFLSLKEEKKQILTKINDLNNVLKSESGVRIEMKLCGTKNYLEIVGSQMNGNCISKYALLDIIYSKIKPLLPENYRLIVKLEST